jgi:O-antigen/teichoic acid export membrane protein
MEASFADKEGSVEESAQPLRYRTARAALTSGATEVVTRVLAVALSITTARVLDPREVGLLGLAVILTGLISMTGCYPETAAVAAPGRERHGKYAAAAFFLRMTSVAFLIGLLTLTFPFWAGLLAGKEDGEPLRRIVQVLALAPVVEALACYPQVILQRRLDLSCLAAIQALQPVVLVGLGAILLLKGRGPMGVVWASLTGTSLVTALVWLRSWWMGWLQWEGSPRSGEWREVSLGSVRLFTGGFGGYLGARLDNLLVAGALGPTAMSFYSMAWNASRAPAGIFARAINTVLVPTLTQIGGEPFRTQRAIHGSLRHSYMLLTPICIALFVTAPSLVAVALGDRWAPIVPAMRVMCFTVLVGPLIDTAYALFISGGQAHRAALGTGVRLVSLIVTVRPFTLWWGIPGAAISDMVSGLALTITLCLILKVTARRIELGVIFALAVPMTAALLAGALTWWIGTHLPLKLGRLLGETVFFLLSYPSVVALLGGKSRLTELAILFKGMLRRTPFPARGLA